MTSDTLEIGVTYYINMIFPCLWFFLRFESGGSMKMNEEGIEHFDYFFFLKYDFFNKTNYFIYTEKIKKNSLLLIDYDKK